jgi:hypothetical protein
MSKHPTPKLTREHAIQVSAAAAASATVQSVVVRPGRSLCESNQVGTTKELRKLAVQHNIPNASTMSKSQLCMALAAVDNEKDIEQENADPLSGFLDLVTQEVMVDPIVASDGYSYDYTSLRNMFVAAMQQFENSGRPRAPSRRPRVMSLRDSSVELSNPFSDISGLDATFPLIRNHDLRGTIEEWRLQHGFAKPDTVATAASVIHAPRDQGGFEHGIYNGAMHAADANNRSRMGEDADDPHVEDVSRPVIEPVADTPQSNLISDVLQESLDAFRRLIPPVGLDSRKVWFHHMYNDLLELVSTADRDIRMYFSVIEEARHAYDEWEADWRVAKLVRLMQHANLFAQVEEDCLRPSRSDIIDACDAVAAVSAASPSIEARIGESFFDALPRNRTGRASIAGIKRYLLHVLHLTPELLAARYSEDSYAELCRVENNDDMQRILQHLTRHRHPRVTGDLVRSAQRELDILSFQSAFSLLVEHCRSEVVLDMERRLQERQQHEQPSSPSRARLLVARCLIVYFGDKMPFHYTHSQHPSVGWSFSTGRLFELRPDACAFITQHDWVDFYALVDAIAKATAQGAARRKHLLCARDLEEAMARSA